GGAIPSAFQLGMNDANHLVACSKLLLHLSGFSPFIADGSARVRRKRADMSRYHELYSSWKNDPQAFWAEAAREISWYKLWDRVFDPYMGEYGRWFAGAECNTAYNCLDRHVESGRGEQNALIYDSPVTQT